MENALTALEALSMAAMLDRIAEQALQSGSAIPAELIAAWGDAERRLLRGLRTEERGLSSAGSNPAAELRAIGQNERIRNLVWEVTISLDLRAAHVGAMRRLATLLRAAAGARAEEPTARRMSQVSVSPPASRMPQAS